MEKVYYYKDTTTECFEGEIWKDVEDFKGIYKVSNFGRVKSIDREIECTANRYNRLIKRKTKGVILKQKIDEYGYLKVALRNKGDDKYPTVHRLVAFAFLELNDLGTESINHRDADKLYNLPHNLEWSTPLLQNEHAWLMGCINENTLARGESSGVSKLKNSEVIDIYENKNNLSLVELSEKYKISTSNIRFIWNDTAWTHITKGLTKNAIMTTLLKEEVVFLYTNPLNLNTQELGILFDLKNNTIRRIYNQERQIKFTKNLVKNQIVESGMYLYKCLNLETNEIIYFNNVNKFIIKNKMHNRQSIMKSIRDNKTYNNFKFEFCSKEEYTNYLKSLYEDYLKLTKKVS